MGTTVKKIIELDKDINNFAILVIEKSTNRASLEHYYYDTKQEAIIKRTFEQLQDMKEYTNEILDIAFEICNGQQVTLWKY